MLQKIILRIDDQISMGCGGSLLSWQESYCGAYGRQLICNGKLVQISRIATPTEKTDSA